MRLLIPKISYRKRQARASLRILWVIVDAPEVRLKTTNAVREASLDHGSRLFNVVLTQIVDNPHTIAAELVRRAGVHVGIVVDVRLVVAGLAAQQLLLKMISQHVLSLYEK